MRKRGLVTILLACAMTGCRSAEPAAAPAPATVAEVAPPPAPPPPPPAGDPGAAHAVCRVVHGQMVPPESTTVAGDTTAEGLRYTAEHASMATWFINNEVIRFQVHRYVKYGLPRVLEIGQIVNVGSYQGVPVFATPGADREWPEIIYLSISPLCEFQPYESNRDVGEVRG